MMPGERTLRLLMEPIAGFLAAPGVTEIVCQKPGEIGVETRGVWAWHDIPALGFDQLESIANLAASLSQQDVGPDRPLCSGVLPDGHRIQICCPPVVPRGTISLTIRRPSDFEPTLAGLTERGVFNETKARATNSNDDELLALHAASQWDLFFRLAVRSHKNIIASGNTGSGKTTVAKAFCREIPSHERIVTIEDTRELGLPHRNLVSLLYSKGEQGMTKLRSEDLIEAALRMRPDRIMMGELRDGAAYTFVRSIAAGHPGSITTCHAPSAAGAFTALSLMLKQNDAGKRLGDADAMAMLRESVDIVAHCVKREDGSRGVSEVYFRRAA